MEQELPYIASAAVTPLGQVEVKPEDERDLPVLTRISKLLHDQIKTYQSIDRLTMSEDILTIKEQLAVNKAITIHLQELRLSIDTIIKGVKEQYNE